MPLTGQACTVAWTHACTHGHTHRQKKSKHSPIRLITYSNKALHIRRVPVSSCLQFHVWNFFGKCKSLQKMVMLLFSKINRKLHVITLVYYYCNQCLQTLPNRNSASAHCIVVKVINLIHWMGIRHTNHYQLSSAHMHLCSHKNECGIYFLPVLDKKISGMLFRIDSY